MRMFAHKQNQARQWNFFSLPKTSAVEPLAIHQDDELAEDFAPTASTPFTDDFSRIPVSARDGAKIQPKLTVNASRNINRQEAGRVSEPVMRMPEPQLQRACACGACSGCQVQQPDQEPERLQMSRERTSDQGRLKVPPIVHDVLRSPGQPLDAATRAYMEPRFGYDFSRVRVHLDSQAAASARDVGALAYTVGRDIVFAQGRFAPHTTPGQRLLAHELTHTLQQGVATEQVALEKLRVGQPDDRLEHEAEKVSTAILSGRAGVTAEMSPHFSMQLDRQTTLRREPKPDAGSPETDPLHTVPPKQERDVMAPPPAPAPAKPACSPPTDIALPCRPKSVSNDEFLKQGGPREAMGVTIIAAGTKISAPEVITEPVTKGKGVVIKPTKATPLPCQSFVTKASEFWRTVPLDPSDPKQSTLTAKCSRSFSAKFNITPEGEQRITEAEMEHCTDYKYAFDISLGCYAAVVNDLAKKKTVFSSDQDAVNEVTKRVGLKPDAWMTHYLALIGKSADRDTNKWHTAIWQGPSLFVEEDGKGRCKTQSVSVIEINKKSYPMVNKHSTPDVVQ